MGPIATPLSPAREIGSEIAAALTHLDSQRRAQPSHSVLRGYSDLGGNSLSNASAGASTGVDTAAARFRTQPCQMQS